MHSQAKAFRNDVLLAEKRVKEMDPNALMLKLANTASDQPTDWPQATAENFALVLSKMAEVARPRDRVLLFISTHANPGLLNISAAGKNLQPLTPQILSDALAPLHKVPTLVVLSACRSAGGVLAGSEGVLGLTSSLMQAGARSVVATGWRIPDRDVVPLVESFYAALARGMPVAAALQAAKRDALRSGASPRTWAAFTAIGDPSVNIALRAPRPWWSRFFGRP